MIDGKRPLETILSFIIKNDQSAAICNDRNIHIHVVCKVSIGNNLRIGLCKPWINALRNNPWIATCHNCHGCSEETEARSAGVMDTEHIEAFQRFVQSEFLDKKKVGSKVIPKAKGAL